MKNKAIFITSWPLTLGQGSGTALFVRALQKAVEASGSEVEMINPDLDSHDYVQFTYDRLKFNKGLAQDPRLAAASWLLGIDYDGYAIPRRSWQPFIASARAVFADLVDTEPEPYKTMLRTQAYFEGQNLRLSDLVITPSRYARGKVMAYYQVPAERVHAVPNGIDLLEWDRHWNALPEPDPSRRPTVLAVSKLYPRKKIATLIQAVPILRLRYPDIDVRIVGGGFEWEKLQLLTRELNVADNVTWLGDINERRQVIGEFKNSHVFTHPSIQDAFANVCLESMAAGRAQVVSDAASMPDMVRQAKSGLVVPPENPAALAHALITLLEDEPQRQVLAANGRRFAQTMTWDKTASRFLELVNPHLQSSNAVLEMAH